MRTAACVADAVLSGEFRCGEDAFATPSWSSRQMQVALWTCSTGLHMDEDLSKISYAGCMLPDPLLLNHDGFAQDADEQACIGSSHM